MKKLKTLVSVFMLFALLAASVPAGAIQSASRDIFSMDTYMTITCYGRNAETAADSAINEITRLNDLLSVGIEGSEIATINRTKSSVLSADSAEMVEKALDIYHSTDGLFDITIYPMMELWGFTTQEFRVPSPEEITETLARVDSSRLQWDPASRTLTLGDDQGIDLGGIAKGYTSDRLTRIFADYDLRSAVISLGGNVHCYSTKPDGSLWKVGIQSPFEDQGLIGVLQVANSAVITSGGYERYFTDPASGKTYHHIIDPTTGYSAESGLLSVTIVSPSGILADALSTSCFIMGLDKASDYWRSSTESFNMIIMTEDSEIYITEGLQNVFSTDYPLHVIRYSE